MFIRRVQQILARYDGALLQVTIGDKGSYLYAANRASLCQPASRAEPEVYFFYSRPYLDSERLLRSLNWLPRRMVASTPSALG